MIFLTQFLLFLLQIGKYDNILVLYTVYDTKIKGNHKMRTENLYNIIKETLLENNVIAFNYQCFINDETVEDHNISDNVLESTEFLIKAESSTVKNSDSNKSEFITLRLVCHLSDSEIIFTSADMFAESIDQDVIFLIYYPQDFIRFKESLFFNTEMLKSQKSYKMYLEPLEI